MGDGASMAGVARWNEVRQLKIAGQLVDEGGGGGGGGKRKRAAGERDIRDYFGVGKRGMVEGDGYGDEKRPRCEDTIKAKVRKDDGDDDDDDNAPTTTRNAKADATSHSCPDRLPVGEDDDTIPPPSNQAQQSKSKPYSKSNRNSSIFASLTFYINGSTAPRISDHMLKRLLVAHGAQLSISMTRRSVTHVILGNPNRKPGNNEVKAGEGTGRDGGDKALRGTGSGGGLAAGKLQHEISLVGGEGVKYVGVEWYGYGSPAAVSDDASLIPFFPFPVSSDLLFDF